VKYRRKVLDEPVSARAREIFEYIAPDYKITLEEWRENKLGEVFSTDNVYYWTMAQKTRSRMGVPSTCMAIFLTISTTSTMPHMKGKVTLSEAER